MGYTVTRPGNSKDFDFESYVRLLRQKGLDPARLPRVPEPETARRWLPVWPSQAEAQTFADELTKRTQDGTWEVVEVKAPASEGPLGPVEMQVGRQRDGWTFALHPLSRLMIQKVFPGSCRAPSVFIALEAGEDFLSAQADLGALSEQVALILTGLSSGKLLETFGGYRVYDLRAKKELFASGPIHI